MSPAQAALPPPMHGTTRSLAPKLYNQVYIQARALLFLYQKGSGTRISAWRASQARHAPIRSAAAPAHHGDLPHLSAAHLPS